MAEIIVTFQTENGNAERTLNDIFLETTLRDAREAVQMLLGLPENPPCRFRLERTDQILRDNQTFKEVDIKHGDTIILISSVPSTNNPFPKVQSPPVELNWRDATSGISDVTGSNNSKLNWRDSDVMKEQPEQKKNTQKLNWRD